MHAVCRRLMQLQGLHSGKCCHGELGYRALRETIHTVLMVSATDFTGNANGVCMLSVLVYYYTQISTNSEYVSVRFKPLQQRNSHSGNVQTQ